MLYYPRTWKPLLGGIMTTLLKTQNIDGKGPAVPDVCIFDFPVLLFIFKKFIDSFHRSAVYDMNGLFNIPDSTNVISFV
jgi:hypothetical protein